MQTCERDCPVCVGFIEVYQGPRGAPYFVCLRCNTKGAEQIMPLIVRGYGKRLAARDDDRERAVWLC